MRSFKRSRCSPRLQSERSCSALGMSTGLPSALPTPLKRRVDSTRSPLCVRLPLLTRDVGQSCRFSGRGGSSACVCARLDDRRSQLAQRGTAAPQDKIDIALLVCTSATRPSADPLCSSCRAGMAAVGVRSAQLLSLHRFRRVLLRRIAARVRLFTIGLTRAGNVTLCLLSGKTARTAAMSSGRRPQLIAAVLAILPDSKPFIHTRSMHDPGGSARTLWEPDPARR